MTFVDLYDTLLDIELGTGAVDLFTLALRKYAINQAQDDFARKTGCTVRYANIAMSDGTGEYALNPTNITDYIRLTEHEQPYIKIVDGTDERYIQGDDFPRRTSGLLNRLEPGWRAADDGTPAFWYLKEDGGTSYLGVYPPPDIDTETFTLVVPYVADPADMTASGDIPFTFAAVPTRRLYTYHQALVHFAAAQLEPLRKNYSGVQRQLQLYAGYVAQYYQDERKAAPDQITLARNYFGESRRSLR
jgi:hypothetical protein